MNIPLIHLYLAWMLIYGVSCASAYAQSVPVAFTGTFAPSEEYVSGPESSVRRNLCLNGTWQFQPVTVPSDFKPGSGVPPELPSPVLQKWEAIPVKIPSPWNVNTWGNGREAGEGTKRPFVADSVYYPSYPASWDGVRIGWLRRSFTVPRDWHAERFILHFEAVAGEATVLVNGKPAGTHFDSFLPFDLDVTDLVKREGENELLVGVRKSSLFNVVSQDYPPNQQRTYPNGSNMDELVGIWNDVTLLGLPAVRIEDVFVQPQVEQGRLVAEVTVRNDTREPRTLRLGGDVSPWVNLAGKDVIAAPEPKWKLESPVLNFAAREVTVPPGATTKISLEIPVKDQLKLWSPSSPNLYGLTVKADMLDGRVDDRKYARFGWRQFTIKGRDLLLNGQPIQMFSDFSHPFGPFISSRRYVAGFYGMIKAMGGNAVRPHANVHPRLWLDLADEMGLCVLDESAIFGSSISLNLKEPVTWERFARHVDGLVLRDRNHPSVVGWSPGNEMFALFFKTKDPEKGAEVDRLKQLALRPRALDPTRPWLSVDGDKDLDGTLPVWSRHLGIGLPTDLPDTDKPRSIGEHGGTYYAGPVRLRDIAGDQPYESYAARNEILAADLYRMITTVAKPELAFFSPSELMWFGLEQLPFGYGTDTRPPNKSDGVFFPNFVENAPGVQIERLPPYVMTINPGFDPQLPTYRPMAMFEAMKAALDPRGPQAGPWDKMPEVSSRKQPAPTDVIPRVDFIGDTKGGLYQSICALGVPLVYATGAADSTLLVIDAQALTVPQAVEARTLADRVWKKGGLVWVMAPTPEIDLKPLAGLLPAKVELTSRQATSLVKGKADPRIDGFNLGDLYFVGKEGNATIQRAGLTGPLVESGKVLLTASNSDWSLFDRQPETAKCASMLIYERLKKPAGASLVEASVGNGRLWLSTLDPVPDEPAFKTFWTQLWQNLGVKVEKIGLVWLVPVGKESVWHYTTQTPAGDWTSKGYAAADWSSGPAGFGTNVPKSQTNTPWTTADIYLRRTFSVATLPRSLRLYIHHDEDAEIYLNGTRIFAEKGFLSDYRTIPLGADARKALVTGENVLAVHCKQTAGGQYIDVGLAAGGVLGQTNRPHDLLLDGPLKD